MRLLLPRVAVLLAITLRVALMVTRVALSVTGVALIALITRVALGVTRVALGVTGVAGVALGVARVSVLLWVSPWVAELLLVSALARELRVAPGRLGLRLTLALRLAAVDRSRPAALVGRRRRAAGGLAALVVESFLGGSWAVPGRLVARWGSASRVTRALPEARLVARDRRVRVALRCRLVGVEGRGLVDGGVHGFAAAGIAGITLARQRLPLPGDLVDPGGLVAPPVVAGLRAPAVHRAPRIRPGDWRRSVTAQSTSQSKMCGDRPETRVESPGSTAGFGKEINGVSGIDASVLTISPDRPFRASITTFGALAWSGFRRYATYRQATIAGSFTNIVFGFLRCYVLLAVAAGAVGNRPGGYGPEQLATYVWVGQGLLAVVGVWGWTDLADRIRTGDIASDLLRPVPPVVSYLAADLGRALHALLTRFVGPLIAGAVFFHLYLPHRWPTIPLFTVSVLLAVIGSFGCRYLVNATAYWLHDARGVQMLWTLGSGVLAGLYFPLRLLPDWAAVTLWIATPLPGLLQTPLDVLVERDPPVTQVGLVALQAVWAVLLLWLAQVVQRRAEHKLVVQGG
jgi:ABC-2 type transport system permease protein